MAQPSLACKRALTDATALCPKRSRVSDGLMGDSAHQARKSDHNDGNAYDLTHDPDSGVDCNLFAKLALLDHRTTYVIWNRQICNVSDGQWKPYHGKNGHTHHMHVSINAAKRNDASPWPWASIES